MSQIRISNSRDDVQMKTWGLVVVGVGGVVPETRKKATYGIVTLERYTHPYNHEYRAEDRVSPMRRQHSYQAQDVSYL